jgi:murein DD-endopeptidase MepM/ murein hydrolase activator NlpD
LDFPKATRRRIVYATATAVAVTGSALLVWKQLPTGNLPTPNVTPSAMASLTAEAMSVKEKEAPQGPFADSLKPEMSPAQPVMRDKVETYVVQEGDSIGLIAEKYGLKAESVLHSNGGTEDIHPGDELRIPRVDGVVVEIMEGDTLWELGKDYGVTDTDILAANPDVDPAAIQVGTKLLIPATGGEFFERQVVSRSSRTRSRRWVWPTWGDMTDDFGWRTHPVYGGSSFHDGIDLGVGSGTPVGAASGGEVIMASRYGGYGLMVRIDHGNGLASSYAHLSSIEVSVGDEVGPGDLIGYSGNTGVSTGPHLHFIVSLWGEPVDPLEYLP